MHPLDLRTIRTSASGSEIDKVIEKSLSDGTFDDNIAAIVKDRAKENGYMPSKSLAVKIVKKTKDIELLEQWFYPLKYAGISYLIEFYKDNIEFARIEQILTAYLYKYSINPADSNKFEIIRSINDVGSIDVLEILQTIEQELRDRAIAAKNFGRILPAPEVFEAKLNAQFYDLVSNAISNVKERNFKPPQYDAICDANKLQSPLMPDHITNLLNDAERHFEGEDYKSAANYLRDFLEAMSEFLYDIIDPGAHGDYKKFIDRLEVLNKNHKLHFSWQGKEVRFPPMIRSHLRSAKQIADSGSHFLGAEHKLRREDIKPSLDMGRLIHADAVKWLKSLT